MLEDLPLPSDPVDVPTSTWQRILEWLESSWFMLGAGTILSILGGIFYAPVFVLCGIFIVLGFHKVGVISGRPVWKAQVPVYFALCTATFLGLYWLHTKVQQGLKADMASLAKMIVSQLAEKPQPQAPAMGQPNNLHQSSNSNESTKLLINKNKTTKYEAIALSDEMRKWELDERVKIPDLQKALPEFYRQYPQKFEKRVVEITNALSKCGADTGKLSKDIEAMHDPWQSITDLEAIMFDLVTAAHSIPHGQPGCGTGTPTQGFGESTEMYYLLIGGATEGEYKEDLEKGPQMAGATILAGKQQFKIYLLNGIFCVDAKVFGGFGLPLIDVRCNRIGMIPNGWDTNYTNEAMEVVNQNQVPMFQVIFESSNKVRINGVFLGENDEILIITPQGTQRVKPDTNSKAPLGIPLRPLFKYPSWKYLHQYAN